MSHLPIPLYVDLVTRVKEVIPPRGPLDLVVLYPAYRVGVRYGERTRGVEL